MQGDKITILVLPYVENILMIRNLKVKIAWLISQLQSKFEMSTFGRLKKYLEVEFVYFVDGIFNKKPTCMKCLRNWASLNVKCP